MDRLQFFRRSANKPAGKGVGEVINNSNDYTELNKIKPLFTLLRWYITRVTDDKELEKHVDILRKSKKFSSASKDAEKRVSVKGSNVFISNPGSGTDTFYIEQMIKKQLKDWKMKGKVGSSTHVQR